MRFEFATATRILFGRGTATESATAIRALGSRILLVTGSTKERSAAVADALRAAGCDITPFAVSGEPTVATAEAACALGRDADCDAVVAVGGGSVIDAGKAAAALMANRGAALDYLEVVGRGLPLTEPSLPFAALPTTAGTGTEVTRNAVLGVPEHRVKVSMRSPSMLPDLAIVDPLLTADMPPRTTAAVGLDALTQVIEPYVTHQSNPLTDALCKEGIARGARALVRAYTDGSDMDAREEMCTVSLFGGLALANAKLGAVHGFAAPLGGMFDAPHGEICGILLPHTTAALTAALRARTPGSEALTRLDTVAQLLTGRPDARAEDGVDRLREMGETLGLPGLSAFGVKEADIPDIVAKAARASSMKGSPIPFTDDELAAILTAALDG